MVLAARLIDRVGKGLRGAPRDALVADLVAPEQRGAAYGLRQALDTVGAVLGPLAAIGLMLLLANDIRAVLWLAAIPAVISVLILVFFVTEGPVKSAEKNPVSFAAIGSLGRRYWAIVSLGAVFTLARFSEAFLVIRGQDVGLSLAFVPLALVVMNVAYTAIAYPAGLAADNGHRKKLIVWGLAALIASDLVLGYFGNLAGFFAGVVLWGVHMGLTQGLLSTLVADAAPADLRGTAFGVFHVVSGMALLAASVLAGWLWGRFGPEFTFYAGAAFTAVSLIGLLATTRRR
jgi:MFS family permease